MKKTLLILFFASSGMFGSAVCSSNRADPAGNLEPVPCSSLQEIGSLDQPGMTLGYEKGSNTIVFNSKIMIQSVPDPSLEWDENATISGKQDLSVPLPQKAGDYYTVDAYATNYGAGFFHEGDLLLYRIFDDGIKDAAVISQNGIPNPTHNHYSFPTFDYSGAGDHLIGFELNYYGSLYVGPDYDDQQGLFFIDAAVHGTVSRFHADGTPDPFAGPSTLTPEPTSFAFLSIAVAAGVVTFRKKKVTRCS